MNEKFWDLSKAKQDNMINGSLKVFSRDGFKHASTDEIVSEASVSKGLLFHYFISKSGLYAFLTEYCARFALVEINSEIRRLDSIPFFELQNRLTKAEMRIMRQYPHMLLFLESAARDDSAGNLEETRSNLALYTDRVASLVKDSVLPPNMTSENAEQIHKLIHLMRIDSASSILRRGSFSSDQYLAAVGGCIQMFESFY